MDLPMGAPVRTPVPRRVLAVGHVRRTQAGTIIVTSTAGGTIATATTPRRGER